MDTAAFLSLYGLAFLLIAGVLVRQPAVSPVLPAAPLDRRRVFAWLAIGVALRLPLLWDTGFHYDTGTYKAWALTLSDPADPLNLYKEGYFADYPPFYMYVLAAIGALARVLELGNSAHFTALIKLPALLCDMVASVLLLRLLQRQSAPLQAWGLASLYWLNPALIFTGALWGQSEAVLCLLILLGWLAWCDGRLNLAAMIFAAAFAFKPQGALYAGTFGIAVLISAGRRQIGGALATGLASFALIVLPFAWSRPWTWLLSLYYGTASTYDYITVNAYNLWALLGWNWQKEVGHWLGLSTQIWALAISAAGILAIAVHAGRRLRGAQTPQARGTIIAWAFVLVTIAFFMLAPRMHERYILMLLPMLFVLEPARARLPLAVLWTCAALANIAYVYHYYIDLKQIAPGDTAFIRVSSAVNVAVSLLTVLWWRVPDWPRRLRRRLPAWIAARGTDADTSVAPATEHWTAANGLIVAGAVLLALLQGLHRLGTDTYPTQGLQTDGFTLEYRYGAPVAATTALVYAGENSASLRLERHTDGGWVEVVPTTGLKDFYKLHELNLGNAGPSQRYRWQVSGKHWRVNELGLLDADHRALLPSALVESELPPEQAQRLADEPATWLHGRGYLATPYFDEIYHGRTAYEFLHRLPVYETTHPPLGKWLIALGIEVFGMTPFGWRIAGLLAAALTVGALAWSGWLFNRTRTAMLLGGGLGLFEFSRYTLGRYATIDSFLGLFLLLSLLLLWRRFGAQERADWRDGWRNSPTLLAAGACLGAAIATKWSALYAGLGVFAFFAYSLGSGLARDGLAAWRVHGRRLLGAALAFALLPALIYGLSYIPFLNCLPDAPRLFSAEGLAQVIKSQRDMFDYHARLTSTHPFSSPFWTWPLNLKPLWIFTGEGEPRSVISLLGNPLIWWSSTLLLLTTIWQNLRRPRAGDLLLLGAFATLYLPWALIDRATFIYHYYPNVLVLLVLLTNRIARWGERPRLNWLPVTAVIAAGGLFLWFYPTLSGQPVPLAWFESLRWLPTWWML